MKRKRVNRWIHPFFLESDMKTMDVIYRTCNAELEKSKFKKQRPEWFDKYHCWKSLNNSIEQARSAGIPIQLHVVFDGDSDSEFAQFIQLDSLQGFHNVRYHSNEHSLLSCFELAEQLYGDYIYFIEDDYLHYLNAVEVLYEGLQEFSDHILTLYDHPDRYTRSDDFDRDRESIYISGSTHWRTGESTTCTLALGRDLFLSNLDLFKGFKLRDRSLFRFLRRSRGVKLLSSLPGLATHLHQDMLSPFGNWKQWHEMAAPQYEKKAAGF